MLRVHPLPSGLAALSVATDALRHRTLAVDVHGTLFLTGDSGEHWEPVAARWAGRAVKVGLTDAASLGMSSFALAAKTPRPAPRAGAAAVPGAGSSGDVAASLSGTITDPSGAIVPGASVIVSASPTQIARTAKADATGRYLVEGLAPGSYTVEATSPGFQAQKLSQIVVASGQPATANLTLSIGADMETITVNAAAVQLQRVEPVAKMKAPAPAPAVPAPLTFEITTEAGDHWVSPDGVLWQRK